MNMKTYNKIFALIATTFLSLISCNTVNKREETRTLEFYSLNDFHGAYLYDESYEQTGLSKIGRFLKEKKESNPENTFILSSGDMFQGGAESNITYGSIVIETMNNIGFDAMAIGNHEFDWDEVVLKEMQKQMDFPLLGANVFYVDTDKMPSYLESYTILERNDLKVGVIGTIMPNINSSILATISDKFNYKDNVNIVKEHATTLKEKKGCDVVVLATHDGETDRYASLSGYIDAIFLGHDHYKKEGEINNIPYIEGGSNGNYVSHIELNLKLNKNNKYEVISSSHNTIKTFKNEEFNNFDIEIEDIYEKYRKEIESIRDQVLYTFESVVDKSKFGKFVAKALALYTKNISPKIDVCIGSINSGGIRSNVAKGEFTYGDLIKVYPFENTLCILKVSPAKFNQIKNNLGVIYNVPSSSMVDGYYYVATIDYVAYGKSVRNNVEEIITTGEMCRDVVSEYLLNYGYEEVN